MAPRKLGDPDTAPAAKIRDFVMGERYPATREALVQRARMNGAPSDVIDLLEDLPKGEYREWQDILRAHGHDV